MPERKEIRGRARAALKAHYWIYVVICLLAAILGTEYGNSMQFLKLRKAAGQETAAGISETPPGIMGESGEALLYSDLAGRDAGSVIDSLRYRMRVYRGKDTYIGDVELGHSRGVLSALINLVESGALLYHLLTLTDTILGSEQASIVVLAVLGFVLLSLFWVFFINVYRAVCCRMFLEGRIYEKVPLSRLGFLYRIKKHAKASLTMALYMLLSYLWLLTIVLYPVKRYAYLLAPYLTAENPDIPPAEAIRLSSRMMKGHKWEAFLLELSLLPWALLSAATGGLAGILFVNPYRESIFAEYYACVRQSAMREELQGTELLTDRFLFARPDEAALREAYADIEGITLPPVEETERGSIRGFLEKQFGIVLRYDSDEKAFRERTQARLQIEEYADILAGKRYPSRLFSIPEIYRRTLAESTGSLRRYSAASLIVMFFIGSFAGWLWESAVAMVQGGAFVNRGVLHGPWLPIYGSGMTVVLAVLYRFRKKPPAEFGLIVLLCGFIEYFSSWILEMMHQGQRWWDYSGYYLNLNGRICAEGLLVFGVGGMVFVYAAAPLIDNIVEQIREQVLWLVCGVLLLAFSADLVYSSAVPNVGAGITTVSEIRGREKASWLRERKQYEQIYGDGREVPFGDAADV